MLRTCNTSCDMGHLRDTYTKVESWLDLGHFRAAELEFQKLPARALTTKRGLGIWMRLSRGFERWAEVEDAASQLRVLQPRETQPVLLEAEALHQQGQTQQAVFLLVTHAARFQGPAWSAYCGALINYTLLAHGTAIEKVRPGQLDITYPKQRSPVTL